MRTVVAEPNLVVIDDKEQDRDARGDLARLAEIDLDLALGCFTTARVSDGALLWPGDHRRRLEKDSLKLGFIAADIDRCLFALETRTQQALDGVCTATLRWGLFLPDASAPETLSWILTLEPERRAPSPVRTRGDPAVANRPRILLESCALPHDEQARSGTPSVLDPFSLFDINGSAKGSRQRFDRPLRLSIASSTWPDHGGAQAVKAIDRRAYAGLKLQTARDGPLQAPARSGAVRLGEDGLLLEGDWFNLFVFQNGIWLTARDVFPGLTRARWAKLIEEAGGQVSYVPGLEPASLANADAVIATSALLGAGVVAEIGGFSCGTTDLGLDAVDCLRSRLWAPRSAGGTDVPSAGSTSA